jgi:hypothetical protein
LRTCCALPVDFEQYIAAGRQLVGNPLLRRAVEIAMHLGPFEEFVARDHGLEFDVIDEMVFAAVLLARPRPARGVGDGEVNAAFLLQQQADQRGLAGSRRRGDDKRFPDMRVSRTGWRQAPKRHCNGCGNQRCKAACKRSGSTGLAR